MAAQSRQIRVFIGLPNANPFDQTSLSEYSTFPFMEIMQFQGTNSKRSFSRVQFIATRFFSQAGRGKFPVTRRFLHSFDYLWPIAVGKLKEVEISGYEEISNKTLLWCHQISTDFFIGLEKLKIDQCHNIRSLFSSSIAQKLVTLGKLEISSCCEMVKVIEGKEEEEEEEEETPQPVCLFPRLQEVNLVKLPKLGFFCKWRFSVELASLERLWIEECPKMERFTLGSVTTPNLNSVIIDCEPLDAQDLNHVLLREEEIA